jgi:hypothetical protein
MSGRIFEISSNVHEATEQSLDRVRGAIEGYLQFVQRVVPSNVMGGPELSDKVLGYAMHNVVTAFDFTRKLLQVRDVDELGRLQMEFIRVQMQAMTGQAKDLSGTAARAVMDSLKFPTSGAST